MARETHMKVTLVELSHAWERLLDLEGISLESGYRIRRLIDRSQPLAEKMFLKTVKGREMILQCWEKTRALRHQLESGGGQLYAIFTELETLYEQLLTKAYEFRVKAG